MIFLNYYVYKIINGIKILFKIILIIIKIFYQNGIFIN